MFHNNKAAKGGGFYVAASLEEALRNWLIILPDFKGEDLQQQAVHYSWMDPQC